MFKILIVFMTILFLGQPVFAGPGFVGGVVFQQTDTITASPTIVNTDGNLSISDGGLNDFTIEVNETLPVFNANQVQGTSISNASPTTDQFYGYNASNTTLVPLSLTGAGNTTIYRDGFNLVVESSGATLEGSQASGTIDFATLAPADLLPGAVDTTRHTIYLSSTATQAAIFGAEILPEDWNGTSDLKFNLLVATPDAAEAADVVYAARYQIIKAGNALYSSTGFTSIGTFTNTLLSQTTAQLASDSSFIIAAGSLDINDRIHILIERSAGNAADTHGDSLHIVGLQGSYQK